MLVDLYLLAVVFSSICEPNETHNEKSAINSSVILNIFEFY